MYTTRNEAEAMITEALGEHADNHDIDAILDENFEYSTELQQFVQTTSTDEFWASVEHHATEA